MAVTLPLRPQDTKYKEIVYGEWRLLSSDLCVYQLLTKVATVTQFATSTPDPQDFSGMHLRVLDHYNFIIPGKNVYARVIEIDKTSVMYVDKFYGE